MSTTTPVVFEVWSEPAGGVPDRRPPAERRSSPGTLLLAAFTGAVLATGGFLTAAAIAGVHEAQDTATVRAQVDAALAELVRGRDVPARQRHLAAPPVTPERGPCSPVRIERLGSC
jgi:hypothetical protein